MLRSQADYQDGVGAYWQRLVSRLRVERAAGGWKAVNCAKLVRHSQICSNERITSDDMLSGKVEDESIAGTFDVEGVPTSKKTVVDDEGVEDQEVKLNEQAEISREDGMGGKKVHYFSI